MRKRVYIAGPLGKGSLVHNVNQATAAFVELARAGLAPMCPHWSVYAKECEPAPMGPEQVTCLGTVAGNDAMGFDDWMGVDLPWVAASDALLRLPGESVGADMEVSCAKDHGVPVFHSVAAVVAWAKG
jgi:hypothetical protein